MHKKDREFFWGWGGDEHFIVDHDIQKKKKHEKMYNNQACV